MHRYLPVLSVLATVVVLGACGGGSSPTPASTSTAEFGVPECDTYLTKYLACVDKMPAAAQGPARQSLEQTRTAWQQAAATEQGKAALAAACKTASDSAAAAMSAYNCW